MKSNVAEVEANVPAGPLSIVGVGGATVSTVQLCEAAAESLPAASLAWIRNVWSPWSRLVRSTGETHASYSPPSSLHSKSRPLSTFEKANVASVEATRPVGPESIVGASGSTVSTVQVRLAGSEMLPSPFTEWTWKVCEPCSRLE